MAVSKEAKKIWKAVKYELADRGCFNGIDDDVFKELDGCLLSIVEQNLPSATQVAEAA